MQEQRPDSVQLIYQLVLQEAHDISHRCLERLHELSSRYKCPDQKELEQLGVEGANGAAQLERDNRVLLS
jgi:hypothetical protein